MIDLVQLTTKAVCSPANNKCDMVSNVYNHVNIKT